MQRFKITIVLLFIGLFNQAFGQTNLEDVVYINNGSIYRGVILEQYPDSILKIQIAGGSVIVCNSDEIIEISKEKILPKNKLTFSHPAGYFNATSIGLLLGSYGNYYSDFTVGASIQTINGYQINPHVAVGVAICAETINYQMINSTVYGQVNFLATGFTPYVYVQSGMNFSTFHNETIWETQDGKYGSALGLGFGIRFNSQAKIATTFSFGYKRNTFSIETLDPFMQLLSEQEYITNRYLIQLGFTM